MTRHAWLPSQCSVCHAWPSWRVCPACVARFAAPAQRCLTCAMRVPQGVQRCAACLRHPLALDACTAAVDYAYPWAQLLTRFKFQDDPGIADTLAALMRGADGARQALAQADALVPIPLARERLRERGYNQSLLLARALDRAKTEAHWLYRTRETTPQSSLDRAERLRNLRGAFALSTSAGHLVERLRVLLVDDVTTTGATLHAAALTLRAAGAARVDALVFARTP